MSTLPDLPDWQKPQMFYGKLLEFNPRNHRYTWDGKPVPSVTTIINRLGKGDALVQWAANCAVEHIEANFDPVAWGEAPEALFGEVCKEARFAHKQKKDAAADIGTRVHEYAKLILQGKNPPEPLDGPAEKAIRAFWRWVEQHRIEPHGIERRVMSAEHHYAGTTDFYGMIDGRWSVLDFKTGKGVYDEAWWQTSAYDMALREEIGGPAAVRWIVHLNKETGECTSHCRASPEDHYGDMMVWTSLLHLDKALRAARKHPQPKKAV
jgi:hypothetical protein